MRKQRISLSPLEESNLHIGIRSPSFYPLNYGERLFDTCFTNCSAAVTIVVIMEKKTGKIKDSDKNNISWEAPEFEYVHKDVSWYWLSLMIAIVLLAIALWQRNILFAVFVIVGWFVIVNVAKQIPPIWEFRVDEVGIHLRNPNEKDHLGKTYSWQDLEGFCILDGLVEHKQLVIKSKSRFSTFLKINFPEKREIEIEEMCLQFLPKEEYEESVVDHLARFIGF